MNDQLSKYLLRAAAALLLIGLAVALAAIFAYVSVFAATSGFSLSHSDSSWSNFGSYIGGVLGPVFAFLAFIAVLFTVWLQAKQLDRTKIQARLEELQRVIASVAANIDALLSQRPGPSGESETQTSRVRTVFTVLSAAGTAAIDPSPNYIVEATNTKIIRTTKDLLLLQASTLVIELDQLVWCLEEYLREGGSTSVAKFYENRYSAVVCWLDALSLADSSTRVQAYFKPKKSRQFFAAET